MEKGNKASRDQNKRSSRQKEKVAKTGFWTVRFPITDRVGLGF
jgi:hypothetical protein